MNKELPCHLCGEFTLEDFLEDVSAVCGRERLACPGCVEDVEDELRAEHAADEFNNRQVG